MGCEGVAFQFGQGGLQPVSQRGLDGVEGFHRSEVQCPGLLSAGRQACEVLRMAVGQGQAVQQVEAFGQDLVAPVPFFLFFINVVEGVARHGFFGSKGQDDASW